MKTLTESEAGRKCYRLVGSMLVERTVGDVLPSVSENLSGVRRRGPSGQLRARAHPIIHASARCDARRCASPSPPPWSEQIKQLIHTLQEQLTGKEKTLHELQARPASNGSCAQAALSQPRTRATPLAWRARLLPRIASAPTHAHSPPGPCLPAPPTGPSAAPIAGHATRRTPQKKHMIRPDGRSAAGASSSDVSAGVLV